MSIAHKEVDCSLIDVCHSIVPHLQLADLLRWRAVSRTYYTFVVDYLHSRRRRLLKPYAATPDEFIDTLFKYRSLIGGAFALAFVLLDHSISFNTLEIYTPDALYVDFLRAIEPLVGGSIVRYSAIRDADQWGGRTVAEYTHLRLCSGYSVVIYQSTTWSALLPICRAPCTLLFNYVSRSAFGCGYPNMTMQRRGLLADIGMSHALPFEVETMNSLAGQGFSISWSPTLFTNRLRWLDRTHTTTSTGSDGDSTYTTSHRADVGRVVSARGHGQFIDEWGVPPAPDRFMRSSPRAPRPCLAHEDMCPRQARFFGDRASIVDFFCPLGGDPEFLLENWMTPYGTVILWTLRSSYSCASRPICGRVEPEKMLLHDDRYIYLPALPGVNKFERTVHRHHPPLYLYFSW